MDNILRERRLRWLGHVLRMDHQHIPQQALYWQVVPGTVKLRLTGWSEALAVGLAVYTA